MDTGCKTLAGLPVCVHTFNVENLPCSMFLEHQRKLQNPTHAHGEHVSPECVISDLSML